MAHSADNKPRKQFGAIPVSRTSAGLLRILLVTSRQTRRWVIPKGWPMPGRTGAEVAAQEAFEEAGVRGRIAGSGKPVGVYAYVKRLTPSNTITCQVLVYQLKVLRQLTDWPEQSQRERKWFDSAEAAAMVQERALADMLGRLAAGRPVGTPLLLQPEAT
jgi:8-oxo-dGTP pyrophosphatase MutT (NUDIX family)